MIQFPVIIFTICVLHISLSNPATISLLINNDFYILVGATISSAVTPAGGLLITSFI